ncbi:MAG: hypothetical protein H8E74_07705 [Gammaproteobacteria bacterium]|nr:hypothetical protein [Gammaproteobacteria bacterium]
MKNYTKNLVLLSFTLMFSVSISNLYSQTLTEQLDACKEIKVSLIRLQCYDRISKQENRTTAVKPKKRLFNIGRSQKNNSNADKDDQIKDTNDLEKDEQQNVSNADEEFGQPKDLSEPDEINTSVVGVFNGWSGKTEFTLQNGQVWKQSGNGMLIAKIESPKIRIRRGSFGSYILTVEGFNSSIKVKRIK